jgi:hypothetical protein
MVSIRDRRIGGGRARVQSSRITHDDLAEVLPNYGCAEVICGCIAACGTVRQTMSAGRKAPKKTAENSKKELENQPTK